MASIRRIRPPFVRVSGRPTLDRAHPLARGMADCIIWNTLVPFNLATPTAPLSLVGSPTLVTTIDGPAGYVTPGNAYTSPEHGDMTLGDFTIRCRFILISVTGGTYNVLLDKVGSNPRELGVYLGADGSNGFVKYVEISGVNQDNFDFDTLSGIIPLGVVTDLVLTRWGSGPGVGKISLYINGTFVATGTGVNAFRTDTGNIVPGNLSFGRDSSGNTQGDQKWLAFNHWNRQLSDGEIFQLYRDPYCFLTYPQDAIRVGVAAAAPTAVNFTNLLLLGVG